MYWSSGFPWFTELFMSTVSPWSSEKFPAVGKCIYGADHIGPFTDEHIIPFGLLPKGGDWFLPKASCASCADITKRFEDMCLRGTLGLIREQLDLKTRRKKQRGKTITLLMKRPDGGMEEISAIAANLPKYCLCFKWQPPGLLRAGDRSEINFSGEISAYYEKGNFEKFIKDGHGLRLGRIRTPDYARMLAKIGHSYAYAKCGPDTFEPALVKLILGTERLLNQVSLPCVARRAIQPFHPRSI